jgi:hypothetical protein
MVRSWRVLVLTLIALAGAASLNLAFADRQPAMRAALNNLRQARHLLEKAQPDKGGHRDKALELTDQAIKEVETGIAFANGH